MEYIYHYCAIYAVHDVEYTADGILSRSEPLTTIEDYRELKRDIAGMNTGHEKAQVSITSLSLLHTTKGEKK